MKKISTMLLLIISFVFFEFGISHAGVTAIRTSPDNTRAVFNELTARQILALAIMFEADHNEEGMIFVGSVIMLRAKQLNWKHRTQAIKYVTLKPLQFSCFNPNSKGFPVVKRWALNYWTLYHAKEYRSNMLRESYRIAGGLINGSIQTHKLVEDHNILHYVTITLFNSQSVGWVCRMKEVARVGNHVALA
jgi:hypothetical protein